MRLVGFLAALAGSARVLCAASRPISTGVKNCVKSLKNGITVLFRTLGARLERSPLRLFSGTEFLLPDRLDGARRHSAARARKSRAKSCSCRAAIPTRRSGPAARRGPDDPDIRALTGFENVMPAEKFESEFRRLLEQYPKLYALADRSGGRQTQGSGAAARYFQRDCSKSRSCAWRSPPKSWR